MSALPRSGWVAEGLLHRFLVDGIDLGGRFRVESVVSQVELEQAVDQVELLEFAEGVARLKIDRELYTRRRRRLS